MDYTGFLKQFGLFSSVFGQTSAQEKVLLFFVNQIFLLNQQTKIYDSFKRSTGFLFYECNRPIRSLHFRVPTNHKPTCIHKPQTPVLLLYIIVHLIFVIMLPLSPPFRADLNKQTFCELYYFRCGL